MPKELIRKGGAAVLEAGSVDVGNIIADNIHAGLVVFQSGNAGKERTHHNISSPFAVCAVANDAPCPASAALGPLNFLLHFLYRRFRGFS